jgi:hypothetical protein
MVESHTENIATIHLVWHGAGIGAFSRFLSSYLAHPAGTPHTLVLVFKEIPESDLPAYLHLADQVPHVRISMPAPTFDIPAYLTVAKSVTSKFVCLLNSNSEILADNWLSMMAAVASSKIVGAVSATGSWESHLNSTLDAWRHTAARGEFPPWDRVRHETQLLAATFSPFPNYHLRTNALFIERSRLLNMQFDWREHSKFECLVFESGWNGLTHQLVQQGLLPLVVDRNGAMHQRHRWPESRTFRSGNQEHLLVADNRTRDYQLASATMREYLSSLAWGGAR